MTWIRNNFKSQIKFETQQTERNIQEIFAILSKTG